MNLASGAGARATFHIKLRAGVWSVCLDGAFFGDYGDKHWALEGVEEKAREIRARGRGVQILIMSPDGGVESDQVLDPT
jgi:cytosine/adenosine deaminase-related metal-dependent hydrolase